MNIRYTGYKEIQLNDNELAEFYSNGMCADDFVENEYLILKDISGAAIDYYCKHNGNFEKIEYPILGSNLIEKIKPRNPQQYCAMNLLKDDTIPIKLITGTFGSGKSLLCIAAALEAVQKNLIKKIVFVRNNVQVRDTDQLGSLPGDSFQKTLPYILPFADHVGGMEGLQSLIESERLEVIPLGFMRGRSIRNSIIYAMESENLTRQHIQLLMGRVDEGSQLWLDADFHQRDRKVFEESQGLEVMIDRLCGNPLFGYVHLIKSERSKVAQLADLLDE